MAMLYSIFVYMMTCFFTMLSFKYYLLYRDKNHKIFGVNVKYIFFSLVVFFPSLIAAIRYNVGTDYQSYINVYSNIASFSVVDFFTIYIHEFNIEPLFYIICRLIYIIKGNISLLFFIFQALTIYFFVLGLLNFKFKKFNNVAILLYFLILFPLSLNAIRQSVAISISFYGISLFFNEQYKKSLAFLLLSSLFHYTSLVCLIIYVFGFKNTRFYNKLVKLYLWIIILSPFTTFIVMNLINILPIFDKYTSIYMINTKIIFKFGYLINILPTLIFVICIGKKEFLKMNKEMILLFLIQIFIGYFGYYLGWASRLVFYFKTLDIVLIIKLFNSMKYDQKFKTKFYIILSYYILNYIYLYIILNQNQIYPYHTIFI